MTSSTTPTTVEVVAPITGTVIDITDVPDPVAARGSFPVPARIIHRFTFTHAHRDE